MLEWLIFFPISVLLGLKLYELNTKLVWAYRHGANYTEELLIAVKRWNKSGFNREELYEVMERYGRTWHISEWPITRILLRLPSPLKEYVVDWLFRLPTLMFAQIILVIFASNKVVLLLSVFLLWIALWIEVLHIMVNRFTMGYVEGSFARTVSFRLLPYPDPEPQELNPPRRKLIRNFAKLFASLLILVIVGYSGIYVGLNTILAPNPAFSGLNQGWFAPLDLLYFSVVTLATVGYGDITPDKHAVIVRLAVASQIMMGFLLVVFLLTAFSLTVEPEESSDEGSDKNQKGNHGEGAT
ncbi:MAG TPA: potassium channel family protein [Nitrososphaera sp.]|jgi:hypothetical protein|nr:potassium channel family protein [Nitrososphaera sp.]